ncbi:MAG: peroxiredoxin-like family protein [Sedimentibacter sp.]|uniref:peroxiredoxin-like family protein n=1 Tax=Sedimentibacter sp. TaxID=1960295 RepID=UPI003159757D
MKLETGSNMPNFKVDTVFERGIDIKSLLGDNKTAILFLRYAGCTLCRFDMMVLKDEYDKIVKDGGKVIVVLQSDPDRLSGEIDRNFYPYDIVCDPNQELYKQLDIKPANSQAEMIGPGSMEKLKKVQESGLTHGDYEGNEMQLPAAFVVDKELNVLYARYAAHITDMPDVGELTDLLQKKKSLI